MKLVIQIPCHNEEATLGPTLEHLPRSIPGIDVIEYLVIDDGSTDATGDVARRAGAHHVVRNTAQEGLARTFARGIDTALRLGADVIVNTDGDNQYFAEAIALLVRPIVDGEADLVIGDRGTRELLHFSGTKRRLSRLGSWVVGLAAGARFPDAASGFRAFSRAAALRLVVQSEFTYTHETIIQASRRRMAIAHVKVGARDTPRASRLAANKWAYITSSTGTILRAYTMYGPMRVFVGIGAVLWLCGGAIGVRFLIFFFLGNGNGHVQSLLLAVLLLMLGFQAAMMGLVADVIAGNRRLLEEVLWRVRAVETSAPTSADRAKIHIVRPLERNDLDVGVADGEAQEPGKVA